MVGGEGDDQLWGSRRAIAGCQFLFHIFWLFLGPPISPRHPRKQQWILSCASCKRYTVLYIDNTKIVFGYLGSMLVLFFVMQLSSKCFKGFRFTTSWGGSFAGCICGNWCQQRWRDHPGGWAFDRTIGLAASQWVFRKCLFHSLSSLECRCFTSCSTSVNPIRSSMQWWVEQSMAQSDSCICGKILLACVMLIGWLPSCLLAAPVSTVCLRS